MVVTEPKTEWNQLAKSIVDSMHDDSRNKINIGYKIRQICCMIDDFIT